VDAAGLEIYRDHLMVADRGTGAMYSVSMLDRELKKLPVPADWKGPTIGFGMDLNRAVLLVPETGETKGKVVRFDVAVKF
jgi:hypothetical protein